MICYWTSSLHLIHHVTTPLSTSVIHLQIIISKRTIFKFSCHSLLLTVHAKISLLEQTISYVYNWMSYNCISLNPSKTEFLLIGLAQQLSKLSNPMIHNSST
jgi:hypothetical protein